MTEKKVGPDIHTHQAGAKDMNKTIVRKKQVIEPVDQGREYMMTVTRIKNDLNVHKGYS